MVELVQPDAVWRSWPESSSRPRKRSATGSCKQTVTRGVAGMGRAPRSERSCVGCAGRIGACARNGTSWQKPRRLRRPYRGGLPAHESESGRISHCHDGLEVPLAARARLEVPLAARARLEVPLAARARLVLDALDMAVGQRRPASVIHHSDQGCQYTSFAFGERCRQWGVAPSMGSVGDCYDNAMAESFFATLECELLDRNRFQDLRPSTEGDLRVHRRMV